MKSFKWSSLAVAAAYLIAGFFLLFYPETSANIICTIIGWALIILGGLDVITYFMMEVQEALYRNDFTAGVVLILLGALVIAKKDLFQAIIPMVIAIVIIASGFSKLQDGIDAKRLGSSRGLSYVILAAVSIVFGLVIMFNPSFTNKVLFQLMGVALIYSGATDLYFTLYLSGKIRKFMKGNVNGAAAADEAETLKKDAGAPTVDAEFTPSDKEHSSEEQ